MANDHRTLIPAAAYDALLDAGVTVTAEMRGDGQVDAVVDIPGGGAPGRTLALEVKRHTQPLTPGAVAAAADRWAAANSRATPAEPGQPQRGLLLITPSATAETVRHAADLGVSLIALDRHTKDGAHGHLALGPGDVLPLGGATAAPAPGGRRTGATAKGELQIVKTLLLLGGRPQKELARWASVSQPRVSQVLKRLAERDLVRSALGEVGPTPQRTWVVVDWDRLLRHWLSGYSGPGGVTTYWYGLDAPVRQVLAALGVLRGAVLVSGDVAADVVAPWTRPAHATLYTDAGVDLSTVGLTPCPAADSTLALTVPEEAGLWGFADHWWRVVHQDPAPGGLPLADPLQVLHDVRRSPSVDADQTIESLTARIRDLHRTALANLRGPETNR